MNRVSSFGVAVVTGFSVSLIAFAGGRTSATYDTVKLRKFIDQELTKQETLKLRKASYDVGPKVILYKAPQIDWLVGTDNMPPQIKAAVDVMINVEALKRTPPPKVNTTKWNKFVDERTAAAESAIKDYNSGKGPTTVDNQLDLADKLNSDYFEASDDFFKNYAKTLGLTFEQQSEKGFKTVTIKTNPKDGHVFLMSAFTYKMHEYLGRDPAKELEKCGVPQDGTTVTEGKVWYLIKWDNPLKTVGPTSIIINSDEVTLP